MLASRGQRKRWLEAMQVLIGDRKFSEPQLVRPVRRPQPGTGLTAPPVLVSAPI
jgi:hypothetical protein